MGVQNASGLLCQVRVAAPSMPQSVTHRTELPCRATNGVHSVPRMVGRRARGLGCRAASFLPGMGIRVKRALSPNADPATSSESQKAVQVERGLEFEVGSAFYRRESALARDLGVLQAAVHARQNGGRMRVLDAMSGCGVRAARYLHQAGADFVWANDARRDLDDVLTANLGRGAAGDRWRVTHEDAHKLLLGCAVKDDYYDMVDVDSFGSDSLCLGPALGAVKFGGLVYISSTDGLSSGGHRPHNALASYGAFVKPMPFANEIGLRMLIGGAVREASTRNVSVVPLFSYYSHHGPVFRSMLRIHPGKPKINSNYGFIVFCKLCGDSKDVRWEDLGDMACSNPHPKERRSLIVSGPLWIGPLHNAADVQLMDEMARQWGWISNDGQSDGLAELLELILDESQPYLSCGFKKFSEIGKRGKVQTPKRLDFIRLLRQEGYVAGRSHITPNAVKTNCSLGTCIELARSLQSRDVIPSDATFC